jgi:hypothetical protein
MSVSSAVSAIELRLFIGDCGGVELGVEGIAVVGAVLVLETGTASSSSESGTPSSSSRVSSAAVPDVSATSGVSVGGNCFHGGDTILMNRAHSGTYYNATPVYVAGWTAAEHK